jgi:hypothetical protein
MNKIQTLAVLACAVLMSTSRGVYADMANGSYTNDAGVLVPLWDASGGYTNVVDLFSFEYTLNEATSGKLTGAGKFTCVGTFDDVDFNVTNGAVTATGKVTGSSTAPKVSLTLSGSGTGTAVYRGIPLKVTKFKETSTFNGELDGTNREVIGNISATVNVTFLDTAVRRSESVSRTETYHDVVFSLPKDATGAWYLTLNLTPDGTKKYNKGSATILTSTGDTASFTATGTYSSKTDTSAIQVNGTGLSNGSSLSLGISTSGTNLTIETLSGNMFGQSIKYKAP